MTTEELIDRLIECGGNCSMNLIDGYLEELVLKQDRLREASVHLLRRGGIWIASFTGAKPGSRVWRSTKLTDQQAAMTQAKEWERLAKEKRSALGYQKATPALRVRSRQNPAMTGSLTQDEVAKILGVSVKTVRGLERRALAKLANHPSLRQTWQQYLAGKLVERLLEMPPEVTASAIATTQP
jgi:hypothetical protein